MPIQNKRKFNRIQPIPGKPVEIQIIGKDLIDVQNVIDISEGGAKIHAPDHFRDQDFNKPLNLLVSLPIFPPFSALGRIRHKSPGDTKDGVFGIEFMNLSEKNLNQLKSYIRRTELEKSKSS